MHVSTSSGAGVRRTREEGRSRGLALLCLTYIPRHQGLEAHPRCRLGQDVLPFFVNADSDPVIRIRPRFPPSSRDGHRGCFHLDGALTSSDSQRRRGRWRLPGWTGLGHAEGGCSSGLRSQACKTDEPCGAAAGHGARSRRHVLPHKILLGG